MFLESMRLYQRIKRKVFLEAKCRFENRSRDSKTLVIILAGYKSYVWKDVFERIHMFAPDAADICIVSSGVYSTELSGIAEKYKWSYLSLRRNNVCVALNMGIVKFPCAEWIYKIDEDIFITENFFNNTMKTFLETREVSSFYREPAFVAPLIPINPFSYAYLLKQIHMEDAFCKKFGPIYIGGGASKIVGTDSDFAKFMWGEGNFIPHLDDLDAICAQTDAGPVACPVRFTIGAILMHRSIWERMGAFVCWRGIGLGADERQLCSYAVVRSFPMLIALDTCVGHLSFTEQNKAMKEYYLAHKERFAVKKPE